MAKILDKAVTKGEGDTYDFACPGVQGSPCGSADKPFVSSGWPTKKAALARGAQHFAEHKGDPMQELAEFRRSQHVDTEGGSSAQNGGRYVSLGDL